MATFLGISSAESTLQRFHKCDEDVICELSGNTPGSGNHCICKDQGRMDRGGGGQDAWRASPQDPHNLFLPGVLPENPTGQAAAEKAVQNLSLFPLPPSKKIGRQSKEI